MTPKTFFRLLVAATLLGAAAGALASIFPGDIGEEWRTAIEWNGNGGFYERFAELELPTHAIARAGVIGLFVVLFLFLFSVYVGLFFFWRFARLFNNAPCMSHAAFISCLLGFAVLCAPGCVMRRTVKEGNEVVAQGYVVKSPLAAP